MVVEKIKSLLALKNETLASYARFLGIFPQAMNKKKNNESFTLADMVKLADLTGTKLAFIDDKGRAIISFDAEDIKK